MKLNVMINGRRLLYGLAMLVFVISLGLDSPINWLVLAIGGLLYIDGLLLDSMVEDKIRKQYVEEGEIDPREEDLPPGPPTAAV